MLQTPLREAGIEDVKRFIARLESSEYKAWTKTDLKTILRFYMRWLGKKEDVDWIKVKTPRNTPYPRRS